ncbi:5'-methylthioadenosine/S-adenosylhomocysteine nucleosidase family protein [Pectobacterium polaris]|uniref:5'-methylthioadenosine/S-adenosylhomocysteine nucleosidase family protein n=1 Tax=Pectobacterium polaris TaxID=2042057 RepID=UPI001CF28028|nr:response regulator [Pectobacterium polaris]MCA6954038.1 response regulator [Pectobacterium polaris]
MNILILEDEDTKYELIFSHVMEVIPNAKITREKNWLSYSITVTHVKFDLILLDLMVPRSSKDNTVEDHYESLVSTTRDYRIRSFKTPAIVLTQHPLGSGDIVSELNIVDINVIHFNSHGKWKEALKLKLLAAQPAKKFDVVILCALEKEALAFEGLTDSWGPVTPISGLLCREVQIGDINAVIVKPNRMGLVASAVSASLALERFEPRLICMSGICGGVVGESEIYDLLIPQCCHQHDVGKWSTEGFKSEHYDVQLEVEVHNKLVEVASGILASKLEMDLNPTRSEFPSGKERVTCKIVTDAIISSGSAVIAEEGKTSSLAVGQRKLTGFDMEVYSVYEAARNASKRTIFFAAKSVVDDGGKNKGDSFHRIGCLLSAKFIVSAIRSGIANIWI